MLDGQQSILDIIVLFYRNLPYRGLYLFAIELNNKDRVSSSFKVSDGKKDIDSKTGRGFELSLDVEISRSFIRREGDPMYVASILVLAGLQSGISRKNLRKKAYF